MERVVIALAVMILAAVVADVVSRRRRTDPPTQPRRQLPSQLDRADFHDAVAGVRLEPGGFGVEDDFTHGSAFGEYR